jgi:hypothetical protein
LRKQCFGIVKLNYIADAFSESCGECLTLSQNTGFFS